MLRRLRHTAPTAYNRAAMPRMPIVAAAVLSCCMAGAIRAQPQSSTPPRHRHRDRRHHPADHGRVLHRRHRRGRYLRRGARGARVAHAGRTARFDARHGLSHDHLARARCRLRGSVRRAGCISRIHSPDGRRRRRDGTGDARRCCAPGVGLGREDGRDHLAEGRLRCRCVRAIARRRPRPQRAARR